MKTKREIIEFVMNSLEGEYDNDPNDNGGETFWGITRVAWQDYTGDRNAEFPPFNFIKEEAYRVYEHFWDKMSCDYLPTPELQQVVFTFGFNAGYGRATKYMQKSLEITSDGLIGPITRSSYEGILNAEYVVFSFSEQCVKYYMCLDDFEHFGRGWVNRLLKSIIFT